MCISLFCCFISQRTSIKIFIFIFYISAALAQTAINSITTGIIMKLLYCTIHLTIHFILFFFLLFAFFYVFYVTYAVFNVRYFPIYLFIAHCDEFLFVSSCFFLLLFNGTLDYSSWFYFTFFLKII